MKLINNNLVWKRFRMVLKNTFSDVLDGYLNFLYVQNII